MRRMAAARSPARIRPRSTVRRLTAARYLAKNVVAAGLAERCTIQVAYAIGVADPMSLLVDTHGPALSTKKKLEKVLPELFRLTPTNIRRTLKLNRPIYRRTASYGHFGRAPEKDGGFSWEKNRSGSRAEARGLTFSVIILRIPESIDAFRNMPF